MKMFVYLFFILLCHSVSYCEKCEDASHVIITTRPSISTSLSEVVETYYATFSADFCFSIYQTDYKPELSVFMSKVKSRHPTAKTLTLINSDILFDEDEYLSTVNLILKAFDTKMTHSNNFLGIGIRKNIKLSDFRNFNDAFRLANLFENYAIDCFITNFDYDWLQYGGIVIGKIGNDNYLVDKAHHDKNTTLIDFSETIRLLHLGKSEIGNHTEHESDERVNINIAEEKGGSNNDPFDHGKISDCEYKTLFSGTSKTNRQLQLCKVDGTNCFSNEKVMINN